MLTLRIRWKVLYQVICLLKDHIWDEYAVIHPAWNDAGRYCKRCRKSVLLKGRYGVRNGVWQTVETYDAPVPWISVEVRG